ncbi:unnamed protein product [Eretmochelys imbricata]
MSQRDAGSYSCRYSIKSDLSIWSEPSDTMELVVAEGTDPAGPQQPDPAMMEPEGEGPGVRWFYSHRGNRPDPAWSAAPLGCPDFTHADIAHLALSAMVLLIVGLILAEAHYSRPRVKPGSSHAEKKISPGDELIPLGGLKRRHKTSCSQTLLPR